MIALRGRHSLRRRHPGDIADLAILQAELDLERLRSAELARQLADRREQNRKLTQTRDHWRREARRHLDELIALRAQIRGRAS